MNERLIIFRQSAGSYLSLAGAARFCGHPVIDVYDFQQISRLYTDSDGESKLEIRGEALTSRDRVLFLGGPTTRQQLPSSDQWYVIEEWRTAILSTLKNLGTQVVSPLLHPVFFDKANQGRQLKRLGWPTPSIRNTFTFTSGRLEKVRTPDAAPAARAFIILTPYRCMVFPDSSMAWEIAEWLGIPISRTQEWLAKVRCPWVTIPVAMTGMGAYAFGLSPELPGLERVHLVGALEDAWSLMES